MENQSKTIGARPEGTSDQESASAAVREMFNTISPRYDLLNHVLSMNVDRFWWWRTARRFRHILRQNDALQRKLRRYFHQLAVRISDH